jgi:hypothetical protein
MHRVDSVILTPIMFSNITFIKVVNTRYALMFDIDQNLLLTRMQSEDADDGLMNDAEEESDDDADDDEEDEIESLDEEEEPAQ